MITKTSGSSGAIRLLAIAGLLTILATSAFADECNSAIAKAQSAADATYRFSKVAHEGAANGALAAELLATMMGSLGDDGAEPAREAANESVEAIYLAMEAARKVISSLQVASNVRSHIAVEKAAEAALDASISTGNAVIIAKETSWQESSPVFRNASRLDSLARTAARAASDAVQACN